MKLADLHVIPSDTMPPGTVIMFNPPPVYFDVKDGYMIATVSSADLKKAGQGAVVIKNLATAQEPDSE